MRLPALAVSDLHLTANPRDSYRWDLFPWLVDTCARYSVKTLLILGDLTDAKDYHSAELVNQVTEAMAGFKTTEVDSTVEKIYILMGNHDYLKTGLPFFNFLNHLPYVEFITEPTLRISEYSQVMFLPHTKTPTKDWAGLSFKGVDMVFMHQTVTGAVAASGQELDGELGNELKPSLRGLLGSARIYSGDIHQPQIIGDVEYVGSPYPVHFGDSKVVPYRAVLFDQDMKAHDLFHKNIHRLSIRGNLDHLLDQPIRKGDQYKLTLRLAPGEKHQWADKRRQLEQYYKGLGAEVLSLKLISSSDRVPLLQGRRHKLESHSEEDLILKHVQKEDLGAYIYEIAMEVLNK